MSTIILENTANRFKANLGKRRQAGFWLTSDSVVATEYAANAGFDWVLLDMEHTLLDLGRVEKHLLASRGAAAELVVRVPAIDPVLLKRLLDAGIRSFMFPNVRTEEEARLAVAATRYPPDGIRGFSGGHRLNGYGDATQHYLEHYAQNLCILLQVESPQGIESIPKMGNVPGVDALFIGPNDLSFNYGDGGAQTPRMHDVIVAALHSIRQTEAAAGILDFSKDGARRWFDLGFDHIAVGGDVSTLTRGISALAADFA